MKFLSKTQLAFLLDIKAEDARAMMCSAWAKQKGIKNTAEWNDKNKIEDSFPDAMPIDLLADGLGIPTLQKSVDDISSNYLTRSATKKWILCDYPEKQIKAMDIAGKKKTIKIPPALKSMLPKETIDIILKEWEHRFPKRSFK